MPFIKMQSWIEKWATGRAVIYLFAVSFILGILLLVKPIGSAAIVERIPGETLLESRGGYSANEAHQTIGDIAINARAEYIRFLMIDFVFIGVYGLFFASGFFYFLIRLFPKQPYLSQLFWLGFLAALVDITEGIVFFTMLFRYPTLVPAAANAAGAITGLKLLLFSLCLGLMFALFAAWTIKLRTKRALKATI
jgi:hypothetical protein